MFKYNNNHIFTGYLKQLLSSFNLPACKIYTQEFAKYLAEYGKEDPRVLESFDTINEKRLAVHINYLKNNELYNFFSTAPGLKVINGDYERNSEICYWRSSSEIFYDPERTTYGLTRSLNSPGNQYDTVTHEYLGDYLRFLRDYHDINLMSLYNCFNNKICNNIYVSLPITQKYKTLFNAQDPGYRIYAIPVKLFSEYTIALDCNQGIELFCGLYNTSLDVSNKALQLATKTYLKVNQTFFSKPFLFDKLSINHWPAVNDFDIENGSPQIKTDLFTRWDITNREKDLKLFIKIPVSCKSSITILEGDYRNFNNTKYLIENNKWFYKQNHSVLNFKSNEKIDLNNYKFKPISKLQLLALNTGESYPFADRLVEYLTGSAITSIDELSDNIKRVQRVMAQNKNYFKIEGLWENKMQNILYDYVMNSGPIEIKDGELVDKHSGDNPKNYGYHPKLGHASKSMLFDVLGYVDKDAEKLYACWKNENGATAVKDRIQSVDIYDGLYDI